MTDPIISKLKVFGKIYLWEYDPPNKNYAGFHMTACSIGCASLITLVNEMQRAQWPSKKTVVLSAPTQRQLDVPNCPSACKAFDTFTLKYSNNFDLSHFKLTSKEKNIELECGGNSLEQFQNGIKDIKNGKGDYCIGVDIGLWFWWHLE